LERISPPRSRKVGVSWAHSKKPRSGTMPTTVPQVFCSFVSLQVFVASTWGRLSEDCTWPP
jgi:hypothetical protein